MFVAAVCGAQHNVCAREQSVTASVVTKTAKATRRQKRCIFCDEKMLCLRFSHSNAPYGFGSCRIIAPRFLAECRERRLSWDSFFVFCVHIVV